MADLEFFFDPVCPWAWITSRWVSEVQQLRDYDVQWRFISLAVLNDDLVADWYTPSYRASHVAGLYSLRVCDAVRMSEGNQAVARLYTALGTAFHNDQRRPEMTADGRKFMTTLLHAAGFETGLASEMDNEVHDSFIRDETALALKRTGKDVGTPILTFKPGADKEGSFFGPVISTIPRGDEAVRLWDAVELIATSSGLAELKRSNRSQPNFD